MVVTESLPNMIADLSHIPLAERIRPKSLEEIIGQEHLVGSGKPLRRLVETGKLFSIVFWGPPGSGKTTLARLLSHETRAHFDEYSAVTAKKGDVLGVVKEASARLKAGMGQTVLFVDEIHRFSKAQQDAFLPYVEDGTIILFGATTENPSFEIISPLLSRCRVFTLSSLSKEDLKVIIQKGALELKVDLGEEAEEFLMSFANGDARQALNLLESTFNLYQRVTAENLKEALQSKFLRFDKKGEEHYDTISAFIKSMRASQTDAALYYLARMVEAGQDPLFIARRMVIFASEDVGLAQPTALVVANGVFRACEVIGYPECAINLAHGVSYLCKAKKDRSSYDALRKAQEDVKKYGNLAIPLRVRNAPTQLMKDLGYGKGYQKYDQQSYLPDEIKDHQYFYEPGA